MELVLRSRPLGRWNKLEMAAYDSIDLETGNISSLGLKHERPFWFSKVKSFPAF
jgi:F-box protein 9